MTHRFEILSKGLRRTRGEMNQTEARYAELLTAQQQAGELVRWQFEPLTLRLSHPPAGQPAKYTPDFLLLFADGTTIFDDVKSNYRDIAGDVRLKCAAELFPFWVFRLVLAKRKKDGGGFSVTEV